MSWVKVHDGAMGHLKIVRLSDSAFRLWVKGLCYCQMNLTNGLIPVPALRDMGARKRDVAALTLIVPPSAHPLWVPVDAGYQVHDYLVWNDSRDVVKLRQNRAKERLEEWRRKHIEKRSTKRVSERVANAVDADTGTEPNQTKVKKEKKERVAAPPDPRVKTFLEWFKTEYHDQRHGAAYAIDWPRDAVLVKAMLVNTDEESLKDMARILLTDKLEEPFIANTSRDIRILKSQFNWLSNRLATWKIQH